jgi:hypothetical protein
MVTALSLSPAPHCGRRQGVWMVCSNQRGLPRCFRNFREVVCRAVFVLHHAGSANHFQVGNLCQIVQNLVAKKANALSSLKFSKARTAIDFVDNSTLPRCFELAV